MAVNIPSIMLVGRTNVGKSTLFNRLAKNIKTIIFDAPGVTRDIVADIINYKNISFEMIDSGGISLLPTKDSIDAAVERQVKNQLDKCAALVFVVDGSAGVMPNDERIAAFLHKSGKPVILAINKADVKITQDNIHDFYKLGFENIVEVSAEHGSGIHDLLETVAKFLPRDLPEVKDDYNYAVALLGKPNVGKSSLMNALLKEERSIVNEQAGTTRDPVVGNIKFHSEPIKIVDTAGIRRKRAVTQDLEELMVKSSFQAVRTANIILLLLDGSMGAISDQELKLAFYIFQEGKALIILVNKQDIVDDEKKLWLDTSLEPYEFLLKKVEMLNISCKSGKNIGKIMPLVNKVWEKYNLQINDHELYQLFYKNLEKKPLYHKTILLKLYGAKQSGVAPMHIVLYVNYPEWFEQTQLGFFENLLRKNYDLKGVPITFSVKKGRKK